MLSDAERKLIIMNSSELLLAACPEIIENLKTHKGLCKNPQMKLFYEGQIAVYSNIQKLLEGDPSMVQYYELIST